MIPGIVPRQGKSVMMAESSRLYTIKSLTKKQREKTNEESKIKEEEIIPEFEEESKDFS